jgi:hypothetical protein
VIVVNTTYQKALWADVLYACDEKWWDLHFPKLAQVFRGQLWTVSAGARQKFGLRWIMGTGASGLSPDPTYIHQGMNSGYQAIGLAHNFGAARVTLLGYDFSVGPRGERHHHADHPPGLGNCPPSRFPAWRTAMATLAADAKKRGLQVVNASRRTSLKCFPRVELEDALC